MRFPFLDAVWAWLRRVVLIHWGVGLLVASASPAPAPRKPANFAGAYLQRTWRYENGLPDNRVRAVLQTHNGYLWIATPHGLARFDGRKFTVFNHANTPAMTSDDCNCLAEDNADVLWIGTADGILREQNGKITQVSVPKSIEDLLYLCPSRSGGVWGASAPRVCRLGKGAAKIYDAFADASPVEAIDEDPSGSLLIGARGGFYHLNAAKKAFVLASPPNSALGGRPVVAFWQAPDDAQWMLFGQSTPYWGMITYGAWLAGRRNGHWFRKPPSSRPEIEIDQRSHFLTGDRFGNLWMPAAANGLYRYSHGKFDFVSMPHLGTTDYALCACSDREGNLWVGTESSGLQCWTPLRARTYSTRDGLANDMVWSICQSRDGSVWIGTDAGVSRFRNGHFVNFPLACVPHPQVRAVAEDRAGTIWVGTMNGLVSIRNGTITPHRLPGAWYETKIRALCATRDGAIWIGTVRGLTRIFHGHRTKYTHADGLGSDEVRSLLEDRAGNLWIGTQGGGLSCFRNGRFTTLTTTNGLSSDNVWSLYEDKQGVLWIGTEDGLDRLESGHLTTFKTYQGLPANPVNCILEDNAGRLWISYDHGIYWVWKHELNAVADGQAAVVNPVIYDRADGLPTTETNGQESCPDGCKTRDGRLWFPTTHGVAVIDPRLASTDEVAPQTVVDRIRADGQVVYDNGPETDYWSAGISPTGPNTMLARRERRQGESNRVESLGQKITLQFRPGKARVLQFRFTANSFVDQERIRFRYRLVGLERKWLDVGSRHMVEFSDLPHGKYRFEVIACNHHGVWATHGAVVAFRVEPFIYQTWWFYLVCGIALTGLMVGVVGWRVREVRKIQRLEQLSALAQQRQRIARDIHDELGAYLTQIIQLSTKARQTPIAPSAQADAPTERIAALAEEAVNRIGEIVWVNNPKYDTLEDLLAYLREYAAQYLAGTSVEVSLDFPETVPSRVVTGFFRRHLLLIVKEALQNVVKHAAARQLKIWATLVDNELELGMADDGRGLLPNASSGNGQGLPNMRHRVAELHGTFDLKSEPGRGTTIRITVPLPPG